MSDDSVLDEEMSHRRGFSGEHRLPPVVAVMVAGLTYALLPGTLLFAPRLVIPLVEVALLAAVLATHTRVLSSLTR